MRLLACCLVAAIVLTALVMVFELRGTPENVSGCPTPHAPIMINGNSQFTAANGVSGGSGKPSDPYIIKGWNISASTANGILVQNTDAHFVVRDVCVHSGGNYYGGIGLNHVTNGSVEKSTVWRSAGGIGASFSANVSISGNEIHSNRFNGIEVRWIEDFSISFNTVHSNGELFSVSPTPWPLGGIYLSDAANASVVGNHVSSNKQEGVVVRTSVDVSIEGNSISSNEEYGIFSGIIPSDSSSNISISRNEIFSNFEGIYFDFFKNLSIHANDIHSNLGDGVHIASQKPVGISVLGNRIHSNAQAGIHFEKAAGATISSNEIFSNSGDGIDFWSGSNVSVLANDISSSLVGIRLSRSSKFLISFNRIHANAGGICGGLLLDSSISSNEISDNDLGVSLEFADNISISSNNISSNDNGIQFYDSTRVSTYHNRFANILKQAYVVHGNPNIWDDGYPSGGNYWSDYVGVDYFSGPGQNIPGADGIGDTPYEIDSDDRDRYPFVTGPSPNGPPVADAGGPYIGHEGVPLTLDASASDDPDNDTLSYRWDFDNDGMADTSWSSSPAITHTWPDDYAGTVRVEVSDNKTTVSATATVTILNLPPTIDSIQIPAITTTAKLRVAGEKWHDVSAYLVDGGSETLVATITREPGKPQMTSFPLAIDPTRLKSIRVVYTPEDDVVNGQPNGATPAWLTFSFDGDGEKTLHHTFNVRHEDTWEWNVSPNSLLAGREITFIATATDLGMDDLTFEWDFGDGTPLMRSTYHNSGTFPFTATDSKMHVYSMTGTYDVTLRVTGDDGGSIEVHFRCRLQAR